ncbi:hypothetical protein SAMN05428950_103393 [Sphingomonas sp. OV641]|uniref:hypothetical protein n=1 Tax=Sphingomonas sp. OV641 TaxID=1881068 RepID=UPI0008D2FD01|nr:hypothetical protein [Sphingomonas sp. OV641]SEJ83287.1 hypothetical protein SAMN05428950_103393 [Sphingomonas sp. OV641]
MITALWAEIKPILGPLIQALVVLVVGAFTIWFQLRQARTAERKLFSDLHDKRFRALHDFTHELDESVREKLDEDDSAHPSINVRAEHSRSRARSARIHEIAWLFGDDVVLPAAKMNEHAEAIINQVHRIRHKLKSDNPVKLVDDINWNNHQMYAAWGALNDAARHYLYVGHIKMRIPPLPAYTLKELHLGKRLNKDRFYPDARPD